MERVWPAHHHTSQIQEQNTRFSSFLPHMIWPLKRCWFLIKICFFSSLLRHLAAFHSDVKRYLLRATQDKQVELVNYNYYIYFFKQTLRCWKLFKKLDMGASTLPNSTTFPQAPGQWGLSGMLIQLRIWKKKNKIIKVRFLCYFQTRNLSLVGTLLWEELMWVQLHWKQRKIFIRRFLRCSQGAHIHLSENLETRTYCALC